MTLWNLDCALRPKQEVIVKDHDRTTLFRGVETELQQKCVDDPEFSKRKVLTIEIWFGTLVVEVR